MNDQTEVLPAPLQEDSFDIVMRGYSRGQVDEYVKRTKRQVEELEARLARAEREAEDARRDRDRARNEVAAAERKLASHEPSYEDLGERLTQILRLAQEEAEERRSTIISDAERAQGEAKEEARRIRDEVEEKRSEAASEADRLREQGQEEADRVRQEAEETAESRRQEAEQRAGQLVGDAQQRAQEIEESAKTRVEQLEEQHTRLLGQLSTVRDSLQTLLPGHNIDEATRGVENEADTDREDAQDAAGADQTEMEQTGADEDAREEEEDEDEETPTAAETQRIRTIRGLGAAGFLDHHRTHTRKAIDHDAAQEVAGPKNAPPRG